MKQRAKTVRFLMTVALIALTRVSLSANGLNLNGVGSKAIAMGGAFIGQADDYSAIFWNPAGLTQMKSPSISFFVTDLIPSGTYQFPLLGIDAKTKSAMYPSGSVAYFKPINDKLIVGIAAYVPSGTGAKWNGEDLKLLTKDAAYRWESFMGVITVSPVIAYKVSDQFSLGATLNLNYGMLKLWRPGVGQYNEDLSGFAFGATFGALFKPIDKLGIGLTLRTPTKVKFSGDATMAGAALPWASPPPSDAEREATWPLWLGLGISFKATDKLTLNADAQFTNWKKIETIGITYDNAGLAGTEGPSPAESRLQQRFRPELEGRHPVALRPGIRRFRKAGPARRLLLRPLAVRARDPQHPAAGDHLQRRHRRPGLQGGKADHRSSAWNT